MNKSLYVQILVNWLNSTFTAILTDVLRDTVGLRCRSNFVWDQCIIRKNYLNAACGSHIYEKQISLFSKIIVFSQEYYSAQKKN